MAKLVDVPDLGSGAARRVGSSPITRTEKALTFVRAFFFRLVFWLIICLQFVVYGTVTF
jgi:hypothetical protein